MTNRTLRRRITMLIAAWVGCLLLAGCGTAQTSLTEDDTTRLGPARCPGGELKGAGSQAQANAIDQVGQSYAVRCDDDPRVTYRASDSADGVAALLSGRVDWAGSETPLAANQSAAEQSSSAASRCGPGQAWSLPLVAGPVAIVFNLPGVDHLTLSAEVLARVFDGRITQWDDPAIADLNPDVELPARPINVVARSGADGLTGAVTGYLAAHGVWPAEDVGDAWPGVGQGQSRTAGLSTLRGTSDAIGYVEFSAALDNDLPVARLDSGAGPVQLTAESAAAGLATAELSGADGELVLTPTYADAPEGAYPLQVVTYQLACTGNSMTSIEKLLLKDFLGFLASDQQQAALGDVGYSPLPTAVRQAVRDAITG